MGTSKSTLVVALVVLATVAGAVLGLTSRQSSKVDFHASSSSSAAAEVPGRFEVHVAGWVAAPGVVMVAAGDIVADAIAAAGGVRPGAQVDQINLAAELVAGQQVVVPGPEALGGGGSDGDDGAVSLNLADQADLEALPGVGPVLAGRIVDYRDSNGPFRSVDELLEVPGIGEAKLSSIRDLVRP